MDAVQALLNEDTLTLTSLGRALLSKAKHCIKRINRLLGNTHLHRDRLDIYRWHYHQICSVNPQPIVLIDWVDVREYERLMVLRASKTLDGRSVCSDQTFPFSEYNSPRSHHQFLNRFTFSRHAYFGDRCRWGSSSAGCFYIEHIKKVHCGLA